VDEIVVIGVTPTTATGMVVFAMEDVHAGDDRRSGSGAIVQAGMLKAKSRAGDTY
jgi:hypothetical protein